MLCRSADTRVGWVERQRDLTPPRMLAQRSLRIAAAGLVAFYTCLCAQPARSQDSPPSSASPARTRLGEIQLAIQIDDWNRKDIIASSYSNMRLLGRIAVDILQDTNPECYSLFSSNDFPILEFAVYSSKLRDDIPSDSLASCFHSIAEIVQEKQLTAHIVLKHIYALKKSTQLSPYSAHLSGWQRLRWFASNALNAIYLEPSPVRSVLTLDGVIASASSDLTYENFISWITSQRVSHGFCFGSSHLELWPSVLAANKGRPCKMQKLPSSILLANGTVRLVTPDAGPYEFILIGIPFQQFRLKVIGYRGLERYCNKVNPEFVCYNTTVLNEITWIAVARNGPTTTEIGSRSTLAWTRQLKRFATNSAYHYYHVIYRP